MGKLEFSDSARAAAQVASGVGFIGAGVVQARPQKNSRRPHHGDDSLKGLTTAAAIWLVAGVMRGLAAGQRPGAGRRVGVWACGLGGAWVAWEGRQARGALQAAAPPVPLSLSRSHFAPSSHMHLPVQARVHMCRYRRRVRQRPQPSGGGCHAARPLRSRLVPRRVR